LAALDFEPGLRWYRQSNVSGTTLRRLSPSVRSQYRFNDHSSLELESLWSVRCPTQH